MSDPAIASLGDFFSTLPFSDEERARLASHLGNGSAPGRIVRTYVTRTEGYRNGFLKRERIAGARPGSNLYNKQAIERIIEALGDPSHQRYKQCWELYKHAAIAFIKKELPSLDRLLAEVPAPEGASGAAEMLKAVCAHASDYAVTPEHVATFYELWGVPRIDNFSTIVAEWFRADEGNRERRQLNRLITEVERLGTSLSALSTAVHSAEQGVAESRKNADGLAERVKGIDEQLRLLVQSVSDIAYPATQQDTSNRIDERVAGLAEKVNKLAEKVNAPREVVSTRDLHRLENETKANITESVNAATETVAKKLREELSTIATDLDGRLTALSSELNRRRESPSGTGTSTTTAIGGYRSPLIGQAAVAPGAYRLTAELDFVNTWLHHLSRAHDIVLTFEQGVALHRALLTSPVVVCDRLYALSWIHCLAWQSFTIHLAASPTWSAEEDWAPGAEHLFKREATRAPHLVVIHNYDVGLADCYLAPSLVLWALRRDLGALSKLFLLPAAHDHVPLPRILEHAVCFANNSYVTSRPLRLKDGIRFPNPLHRDPPMGAEPKVVAQWSSEPSRIAYDLPGIQRVLGCRLPHDLVASFERTAASVARYVDETSAVAVAMHHQVIPWVQVTHGESKATELGELLSTIAGSLD